MYGDVLPPDQRRALLALKPLAERGFYLAGGTALCLRLAHRLSVDLDLFRDTDFDSEQLLRESLAHVRISRSPLNNRAVLLTAEVEPLGDYRQLLVTRLGRGERSVTASAARLLLFLRV